jgi:hypothetical protein
MSAVFASEKDLVELGRAGDHLDRAKFDAVLVIGQRMS